MRDLTLRSSRSPRSLHPTLEPLEDRIALTVFTVLNADDAGAGSLRQAILDANTTPNAGVSDEIHFAIPGPGVQTIQPTSPLPSITDPVLLDGYTQPGASPNTQAVGSDAMLLVELDGSAAGGDLLTITAGSSTVRGLVINRSAQHGLVLSTAGGNLVEGNWIGTDNTGTADAGNAFAGIRLDNSPGNQIGGASPAQRNVISASGVEEFPGLLIAFGSTGTQVQGNYFGTNAAGTSGLGNVLGISIQAAGNTIGGSGAGEGNVIAASLDVGLVIQDDNNVVQGNLIGTDATGTAALGNGTFNFAPGVLVLFSTGNMIGGTAAGAGNVIAHNNTDGVTVLGSDTGNAILGNSIFANAELGIDLGGNGVTANDVPPASVPPDTDTGANNLQNFPNLDSATGAAATTTVSGSLQSTPDTTFRVEFFASPAADPSGFGEGQTFLGASDVTTDSMGDANFVVPLGAAVPAGQVVTATATDPAGNTSEFSATVTVVADTGAVSWIADTDGSWSDGGNWSTGTPPQPGQSVVIDRPGVDVTVTYNAGVLSIDDLQLTETLVLAAGGSLTVDNDVKVTTGALEIEGGAVLALDTATMQVTDAMIKNLGSFTATGTVLSLDDGAELINCPGGDILFGGGSTIVIIDPTRFENEVGGTVELTDTDLQLSGGVLENAGSLTAIDTAITLDNAAQLINRAGGIVNAVCVDPNRPASWTVLNASQVINEDGGTVTLDAIDVQVTGGVVDNAGSFTTTDTSITLDDAAQLINRAGGILEAICVDPIAAQSLIVIGGSQLLNEARGTVTLDQVDVQVTGGVVDNAGTFGLNATDLSLDGGAEFFNRLGGQLTAEGGGGTTIIIIDPTRFANEAGGTVELTDTDLQLRGGLLENAGSFTVTDTSITLDGAAQLINHAGGIFEAVCVDPIAADSVIVTGASQVINEAGGTVTLDGTLEVDDGTVENSGTLSTDGGVTVGLNGALAGGGFYNTDVVSSGVVRPGLSTAIMTNGGNFTQTVEGVLELEIGGPLAGDDHDQFIVTGTATLDGTLRLVLINGYSPPAGQEFELVVYGGLVGEFATIEVVDPLGAFTLDVVLGPTGLIATAEPLSTVTAELLAGRLLLGGTDADESVRIELGLAGPGTARVTGLDGTRINGGTDPLDFAHVESVLAKMGEGSDTLWVLGTGVTGLVELAGEEGNDVYGIATRDTRLAISDVEGRDWLDFSQAEKGVLVALGLNQGKEQFIAAGHNRLALTGSIENVVGSQFHDLIIGSAAANIVVGGSGIDTIYGGSDRDLVIGGENTDFLFGGPDEDILIAGPTTYDQNRVALEAILAEWTSDRDHETRKVNLTDGTGSADRLNGDFFLRPGETVLDDGARNVLFGGQGADWVFP